jgi:hypothetical protein
MPRSKQSAATALTQEDIQYLLENTKYSEDEIRQDIRVVEISGRTSEKWISQVGIRLLEMSNKTSY